jgi:hypothetical protein
MIRPPSERSHWLTDCDVGSPPGAAPPLVLSLFHSIGWNAKDADPLNSFWPRGVTMFITTPVLSGVEASAPPSLISTSCTVSPPMPMEWAAESMYAEAGAPSSWNACA